MPDRRFGYGRKFGTSTKFGASSVDSSIAWGVEIDWDGDGFFDGTNEARFMIDIRGFRGRTRYVRMDGKGFEKIQTGKYTITLQNENGRFDTWNSASPLYPNVTYGKDAKIRVRDLGGSTTEDVFYGVIQDIRPDNSRDGDSRVVITIVDGWSFLRNFTARYAIQNDITPDEAIGFVLDSVGWPARWGRNLDVAQDNIGYWWANGNKQAASEIEDISESFVGYFYIDNTGRATYKIRSNVASSVVDLTQAILLKDVSLPQPWDNSRNTTRIAAHPRTAADSGVIYQLLGNAPSVAAGAANPLTIFGNYTYNNVTVPAINIIAPVESTDYTMNTQPDGSGADVTTDFTVTVTDFGDRAKFVISNGGVSAAYVTRLQLRGDALYEPNVSDVVYPDTQPAQPREFFLNLLWQQDINVAVDFSNVLGPFLTASHPFPVVSLEARPDVQFAPDLFDIVTLSLGKFGIANESYRVAGIQHESVSANCQSIRTTFYLESYISADDYWVWDTAEFDTSTIFGA